MLARGALRMLARGALRMRARIGRRRDGAAPRRARARSRTGEHNHLKLHAGRRDRHLDGLARHAAEVRKVVADALQPLHIKVLDGARERHPHLGAKERHLARREGRWRCIRWRRRGVGAPEGQALPAAVGAQHEGFKQVAAVGGRVEDESGAGGDRACRRACLDTAPAIQVDSFTQRGATADARGYEGVVGGGRVLHTAERGGGRWWRE